MPDRDRMTGEHATREGTRRASDPDVAVVAEQVSTMATTVDKIEHWVKRWRFLFGFLTLLVGILVPYLSWAGATASSPGQRLTGQDLRIDSIVTALVILESSVKDIKLTVANGRAADSLRFDLLLRMSCREVDPRYRDLLGACRQLGVTR